MKISNQELIADLIQRTNENIEIVKKWMDEPLELLNRKQIPESWSALECVEHLNRYGDFYLPEIKSQFISAERVPETTIFKSGWIGNYFAKSLMPKEKLNKMKTFADMNPNGSDLSIDTLETFIYQQKEMLELLEMGRGVHLRKTKTSVSISSVIKLRLGDTYRVVIYHNQRHLVQGQKAIS